MSETHKCFIDGLAVSEDVLYLTEGLLSRWHTQDKLEETLFVYLPLRQLPLKTVSYLSVCS